MNHPCNELNSLQNAAEVFADLLNFKRVAFFLYSAERQTIQGYLGFNFTAHPIEKISEPWSKAPACPMTISSPHPVYFPEVSGINGLPERYVKKFNLTSLIIIPLIGKQKVIGSILVDREGLYFEPTDEMLHLCVQFGNHAVKIIQSKMEIKHNAFLQSKRILSPREIEVLQLAAYGESTKEMAALLQLSEYTARDYLQSATDKLRARNRTEAVAIALQFGLIGYSLQRYTDKIRDSVNYGSALK
ncbi:LuxR C-terminal-related transcriptional regulator [Aneurinibacillus terranovensis]|uniref:LuxR C-terminal-related transcriptional regulator n=1 Tax=Aneurinibacillus terranovensis TaxID=278991 RepID=UPI000423C208|nr:LuxR C-terminal-related transcriptional regulator [Aneurinibacillus terranovensis]